MSDMYPHGHPHEHHHAPRAAIVDFGLGNLYSVMMACRRVGFHAFITHERAAIEQADCVILPGVGAYGSAMEALVRLDLVSLLRDTAAAGRKPLVGICLGVQLLMDESSEFGRHAGLGIVPGRVVSLRSLVPTMNLTIGADLDAALSRFKVPHIGWNRVHQSGRARTPLLDGVPDGDWMYFVHSFVVRPADPAVVAATTTYEGVEFCSAVRYKNVHAFQFHPERSGRHGLALYANLLRLVRDGMSEPVAGVAGVEGVPR